MRCAGSLLGALWLSSVLLSGCVVGGEDGPDLEESNFVDGSSQWLIRVVSATAPQGAWDVDGSPPDLNVRVGFWETYDPALHPCYPAGDSPGAGCANVGTVQHTWVAHDSWSSQFDADTVVFTGDMLGRLIGLDVALIDDDIPGNGEIGWGTEMASFVVAPYSVADYLYSGGVYLGGPADVHLAFLCLAGCP